MASLDFADITPDQPAHPPVQKTDDDDDDFRRAKSAAPAALREETSFGRFAKKETFSHSAGARPALNRLKSSPLIIERRANSDEHQVEAAATVSKHARSFDNGYDASARSPWASLAKPGNGKAEGGRIARAMKSFKQSSPGNKSWEKVKNLVKARPPSNGSNPSSQDPSLNTTRTSRDRKQDQATIPERPVVPMADAETQHAGIHPVQNLTPVTSLLHDVCSVGGFAYGEVWVRPKEKEEDREEGRPREKSMLRAFSSRRRRSSYSIFPFSMPSPHSDEETHRDHRRDKSRDRHPGRRAHHAGHASSATAIASSPLPSTSNHAATPGSAPTPNTRDFPSTHLPVIPPSPAASHERNDAGEGGGEGGEWAVTAPPAVEVTPRVDHLAGRRAVSASPEPSGAGLPAPRPPDPLGLSHSASLPPPPLHLDAAALGIEGTLRRQSQLSLRERRQSQLSQLSQPSRSSLQHSEHGPDLTHVVSARKTLPGVGAAHGDAAGRGAEGARGGRGLEARKQSAVSVEVATNGDATETEAGGGGGGGERRGSTESGWTANTGDNGHGHGHVVGYVSGLVAGARNSMPAPPAAPVEGEEARGRGRRRSWIEGIWNVLSPSERSLGGGREDGDHSSEALGGAQHRGGGGGGGWSRQSSSRTSSLKRSGSFKTAVNMLTRVGSGRRERGGGGGGGTSGKSSKGGRRTRLSSRNTQGNGSPYGRRNSSVDDGSVRGEREDKLVYSGFSCTMDGMFDDVARVRDDLEMLAREAEAVTYSYGDGFPGRAWKRAEEKNELDWVDLGAFPEDDERAAELRVGTCLQLFEVSVGVPVLDAHSQQVQGVVMLYAAHERQGGERRRLRERMKELSSNGALGSLLFRVSETMSSCLSMEDAIAGWRAAMEEGRSAGLSGGPGVKVGVVDGSSSDVAVQSAEEAEPRGWVAAAVSGYVGKFRGQNSHIPGGHDLAYCLWVLVGTFLTMLVITGVDERVQSEAYRDSQLFALIGSFGAVASMAFSAPTSFFIQPRNVVGGHVIATVVAISLDYLVNDHWLGVLPTWVAGALAPALASAAMSWFGLIHPPAAACAVIYITGDETVKNMGWFFFVMPVLLDCTIAIVMGVLINNMSSQRIFPLYW